MKVNRDTIRDFLHRQQQYGMTDAELGVELGIAGRTVASWRYKYGLLPACKLHKRFAKAHGADGIHVFLTMYHAGETLHNIGLHFGFSRERARQVALELGLPGRKG